MAEFLEFNGTDVLLRQTHRSALRFTVSTLSEPGTVLKMGASVQGFPTSYGERRLEAKLNE